MNFFGFIHDDFTFKNFETIHQFLTNSSGQPMLASEH